MGKRPAEDGLFVGNMGSIQREIRTSMQREDKPTMETGLERIAAKARSEPKLWFTSLAHHITRERVWTNLCQIPKRSAPGVDGQTVTDAKETFGEWVEPVLRSVHHQGYRAPDIRRVYIPKPGKREKGSRLELSDVLGRCRLKCHPSSRTGENPPYGMIGGIEETSASFEARSAPRSYPTAGGGEQSPSLPRPVWHV